MHIKSNFARELLSYNERRLKEKYVLQRSGVKVSIKHNNYNINRKEQTLIQYNIHFALFKYCFINYINVYGKIILIVNSNLIQNIILFYAKILFLNFFFFIIIIILGGVCIYLFIYLSSLICAFQAQLANFMQTSVLYDY